MKNQIKEIQLITDAMVNLEFALELAYRRQPTEGERLSVIIKNIFEYLDDNFTGTI